MSMIRLLIISILSVACVKDAWSQSEVANPVDDKSHTIFNGTDLEGWDGDPRLWSVKDSVIRGETTWRKRTSGNTFLIWKEPAKDFQLSFSFRCNATNNSGVQYRSRRVKKGEPTNKGRKARNDWVVVGYQHEIRNESAFPDVPCFIYDEGGPRGRICLTGEKAIWGPDGKQVEGEPLITEAEFKALMKIDDWNDVMISAEGNRIRHFLNGRLVLDFTDNHPELARQAGMIALQLHAGKSMWAEFKDLRLEHIE